MNILGITAYLICNNKNKWNASKINHLIMNTSIVNKYWKLKLARVFLNIEFLIVV